MSNTRKILVEYKKGNKTPRKITVGVSHHEHYLRGEKSG